MRSESMGGVTAFFVGLELHDMLSGVILSAPALVIPDPPNKCLRGLIRWASPRVFS